MLNSCGDTYSKNPIGGNTPISRSTGFALRADPLQRDAEDVKAEAEDKARATVIKRAISKKNQFGLSK